MCLLYMLLSECSFSYAIRGDYFLCVDVLVSGGRIAFLHNNTETIILRLTFIYLLTNTIIEQSLLVKCRALL